MPFELERWARFQKIEREEAHSKQNLEHEKVCNQGRARHIQGTVRQDQFGYSNGSQHSTNRWESFRNLWRCITVIWWTETKDASRTVMQGTVLHKEVFHISHDFWKTHQEFKQVKKSGYNYLSQQPKLYLNINIKYFFCSFNTLDFLGIKLPRNQEKKILCLVRNITKSYLTFRKIPTYSNVTFGISTTNTHLYQSQLVAVTFKMILHISKQLASSLCFLTYSSPSIQILKYVNIIQFYIKFLCFSFML